MGNRPLRATVPTPPNSQHGIRCPSGFLAYPRSWIATEADQVEVKVVGRAEYVTSQMTDTAVTLATSAFGKSGDYVAVAVGGWASGMVDS